MKKRYITDTLIFNIVKKWIYLTTRGEGAGNNYLQILDDIRGSNLYVRYIGTIKVLKHLLNYFNVDKSWVDFFIFQFRREKMIYIGERWQINKALIIDSFLKDDDQSAVSILTVSEKLYLRGILAKRKLKQVQKQIKKSNETKIC